jgi:hypothetical protein
MQNFNSGVNKVQPTQPPELQAGPKLTPKPIPIPKLNIDSSTTAIMKQNSRYLANRAALTISSTSNNNLATVDARSYFSNTNPSAALPVVTVSLVPTLSPRAESYNNTNHQNNHTNGNNSGSTDIHNRGSNNMENENILPGMVPSEPITVPTVPTVIYMQRTFAVADTHPLNDKELRDAKAADWLVPSKSFEKLTERLMAFYAAHDVKKANYKYVGKLLRRKFGTIHCGTQPESWAEQSLQNQLHDRYLNQDTCSRICAPPGCGGGYDTNALGWLQWWSIILFIPTVAILVVGFLSTYSTEQQTLSAAISALKMNTSESSNVDGISYKNWKISASKISASGIVGVSVPLKVKTTNNKKLDQSLSFIPSFHTNMLSSNDDAMRIAWIMKDANDAIVHSMPPTTLITNAAPRASECKYDGNICSNNKFNTTIDDLAVYKNPTNKNAGCIITVDRSCHSTTDILVSQHGSVEFADNRISLKGVELPLTLFVVTAEFRSPAKTTTIPTKPLFFDINIHYNAVEPSKLLGHFLIIVGCLLFFIGFFFFFVSTIFFCCGNDIRREEIKIYDEHGTIKGYKKKTYSKRSDRYRNADMNDDICLQLYCMFYCCNIVPDCFLCMSNICDLMCSSMGSFCSTIGNICQDICNPFVSYVGGLSANCTEVCSECSGICSDLWEVCFCCNDCSNCDCDCGSLDCAC